MKRCVMLLLCAGLLACEKPNEPDAIPLPMPETAVPSMDGVDEDVSLTEEADAASPDDIQPTLDLDLTVPPPAHDDVEPLKAAPKADIGNVFEKPEKNRPVNVSGEVFLTEEITDNGKAKTTVDGAQVTVEKPIR